MGLKKSGELPSRVDTDWGSSSNEAKVGVKTGTGTEPAGRVDEIQNAMSPRPEWHGDVWPARVSVTASASASLPRRGRRRSGGQGGGAVWRLMGHALNGFNIGRT